MSRRAINIFFYEKDGLIHSIGYRIYEYEGTFHEVIKFLRSRISRDHPEAIVCELKEPITRQFFWLVDRAGEVPELLKRNGVPFEELPYCMTHIVDGRPRVNEVCIDDSFPSDEYPEKGPDYLVNYLTPSGFDFHRLLNDEFFVPVKILWNHKRYVSALKLLFSAVDSISFIEFGRMGKPFLKWIGTYCDLDPLQVTSTEVWELRNSLIHMTNLESHRVRKGHIKKLVPIVSTDNLFIPQEMNGYKAFNIGGFMQIVIPKGLEKWLSTYNQDRDKFATFVERFDAVASEMQVREMREYFDR